MVKNMALIDDKGIVVNIIVFDTESAYTPDEGFVLVDVAEGCDIGKKLVDGVFVNAG